MGYLINKNLIVQEVVNGKILIVRETEEGFFFDNELYDLFFNNIEKQGLDIVLKKLKNQYSVEEYKGFISELLKAKILLTNEKGGERP